MHSHGDTCTTSILTLRDFYKLFRKAGVVAELGHAQLMHLFADHVQEPQEATESKHGVSMTDDDEEGMDLSGYIRVLPIVASLLRPQAGRIDAMCSLCKAYLLPLLHGTDRGLNSTTEEFSKGTCMRMERVLDDPNAVQVMVRRSKDLRTLMARYDGRPDMLAIGVLRTRFDAI